MYEENARIGARNFKNRKESEDEDDEDSGDGGGRDVFCSVHRAKGLME